jgi:hypothetical protein
MRVCVYVETFGILYIHLCWQTVEQQFIPALAIVCREAEHRYLTVLHAVNKMVESASVGRTTSVAVQAEALNHQMVLR